MALIVYSVVTKEWKNNMIIYNLVLFEVRAIVPWINSKSKYENDFIYFVLTQTAQKNKLLAY